MLEGGTPRKDFVEIPVGKYIRRRSVLPHVKAGMLHALAGCSDISGHNHTKITKDEHVIGHLSTG